MRYYMAFSRSSGPIEGAALVYASSAREAKQVAWSVVSGWHDGYLDLDVRWIKNPINVILLVDDDKIEGKIPHCIESPVACESCNTWGVGIINGAYCSDCYGYVGDELAALYGFEPPSEMEREAAHVVIKNDELGYLAQCLNCNKYRLIKSPVGYDSFLHQSSEFRANHAGCERGIEMTITHTNGRDHGKHKKSTLAFADYQAQAAKTAIYPVIGKGFVYPALGLADESGEVLGKIKKIFRDKGGEISNEDRQALKKELGDVLWYLTQICTELDLTLESVAEANTEKLLSRLERGRLQGSGDDR